MNKILCFDTSSNNCSVAISEGQKILFFEQDITPSVQAERLMVMVERGLKTIGQGYNDLNYLAVTVGPGSFTGIRIGLAAAKGILYASNLQGLGINNFDASYYRLQRQVKNHDSVFVILNAYRSQVYVQEFRKGIAKEQPLLMDNKDIIDKLQNSQMQTICTGSGMQEIYPALQGLNHLTILPRFPTIKAVALARFADEKIHKGDITPIEPLYIRPPDAIAPKT